MTNAFLIDLANHLWQSTLFAALVIGLTLLLRKNSARVRYSLWLAASVKFLIPVSALTAVAAQIPWGSSVEDLPRPLMTIAGRITAEMTSSASAGVTILAPVAHMTLGGLALFALPMLWAMGMTWVFALRYREWRVVRRAVRGSHETRIPFIVPVRSSAQPLEPSVVGILKPVLLLPTGIDHHLNTDELQAVLTHERCHVIWRDNLAISCHMLVEAIFWFYPLVWWLGARLVDERERACDEQVLARGHTPHSYAEGILKVCEYYLTSSAPGTSGVSGFRLRSRIRGILKNPPTRPLGVIRTLVLIGCLGASVAVPVMAGIGWHTYTTGVGGLKRIVLDDQLAIVMNTSTTLRVRRSGAREDIVLSAGEALFEALHDFRGSLAVSADSTLLIANQASFSVRIRDPERIDVLVKGGSVELRSIPEESPVRRTQFASAGDAVSLFHGMLMVERLSAEDIARTLAWTVGRLWFDRVTLSEAVAEFNRYNRTQLKLDSAIAGLRIGGAFEATDLDSFTAALQIFGIRATSQGGADGSRPQAIRLSAR